jgi:hypothetical protein
MGRTDHAFCGRQSHGRRTAKHSINDSLCLEQARSGEAGQQDEQPKYSANLSFHRGFPVCGAYASGGLQLRFPVLSSPDLPSARRSSK